MRLLCVILLAVSVCAFPAPDLNAAMLARSMGFLETVSTDGTFDVTRNPATLINQTGQNSIAFGLEDQLYNSYDMSQTAEIDFNIDSTSSDLQIDDLEYNQSFDPEMELPYSFTGALAYSGKISDDVFAGAALSYGYEKEIYKNKMRNEMTMTGLLIDYSEDFVMNSSGKSATEETSYNTAWGFTPSLAYRITDFISIGLKAEVGYETDEMKGEDDSINEEAFCVDSSCDPADASTTQERTDYETLSKTTIASMGIGGYYRTAEMEFGLLLSPGTYTWDKTSYKQKNNKDSTDDEEDSSYDIKKNITYQRNYTEGPSIAAGYLMRLGSYFAFAVEAAYVIPVKYDYKSAEAEEGQYLDRKNEVEKKYTYWASAGVEIDYSDSFKIGIGCRYTTGKETGDEKISETGYSSKTTTEEKYNIISGIIGFNYFYSPFLSFSVFAGVYTGEFTFESATAAINEDEDSQSLINFNSDMDMTITEVFAGFSAEIAF